MHSGHQKDTNPRQGGADMMLPMLAMMGMCVVVFALAVVIPTLGLVPGIAVAVLAGLLMVVGHRKLMGHH